MKAIVVGSHPEPGWFGKLKVQLLEFGVNVVGHWPDIKSAEGGGGIQNADYLLVTRDCCSHKLLDIARKNTRKPILYISHRKAENSKVFSRFAVPA